MNVRISMAAVALVASATLSACHGGASSLPAQTAVAQSVRPTASLPMEFIGFWESWSDTNKQDAFYKLGMAPDTVTNVDVAFSIASSNDISNPQNTYPLKPGAKTIHRHGGKVLLSFGGATSQFNITDPKQFVTNLKAYLKVNPGIYDGFDFDDEVIPANGRQQLINVIKSTRQAFPNAVISFDADSAGADPQVDLSQGFGEDRLILKDAGSDIDFVNVMDYDQYGWKPSTNPNCQYVPGTSDDCYLDILKEFSNVPVGGGKTFPANKVVMGLMIGQADDGSFLKPTDCSAYATWIVQNSYRGIMIWDMDLDNPQAPMSGTGYPKGTYAKAIGGALGT
jgi:chitinase